MSIPSAFAGSGLSPSSTGSSFCVQQQSDLSEMGTAIFYSCGDGKTRGAGIGATKVVDLNDYVPNGDEIALVKTPENVTGYVASANNVKCAVGYSVEILKVRNEDGGWDDSSSEIILPPLFFEEMCSDAIDVGGRWIEANSNYIDCGIEDFQCNWVIVPEEFYGSAGPYYTQKDGSVSCMVPDTYDPVCRTSSLGRFTDFVQVEDGGLSLGVERTLPSLSWYNNIATGQEDRWVCEIPQGAAVEISSWQGGAPLAISGNARQAAHTDEAAAATVWVCEGATDRCVLEFGTGGEPSSNGTSSAALEESKPTIGSTQFDNVKSVPIENADSLCEQRKVLVLEDGEVDTSNNATADSSYWILREGITGKRVYAFCSDGDSAQLPAMLGNPDWLAGTLTEGEEYVALSGSRECKLDHLALPPNFHPALSCEEGFALVASIDSGFNSSIYHPTNLYLFGQNATTVSEKFSNIEGLDNVLCRQRTIMASGAAGSWAHLNNLLAVTSGVLIVTVLAW